MNEFLPFTRPTIDEATIQGVADILRSGWITTGPYVAEFERKLGEYCGGRHVRSCTSATAALEMALAAAGVGAGDEVIMPAMSFAATANVAVRVGARPVFVDVDLRSRNMRVDQIEAAITKSTRAIMPVHFAGLAVDLDPLYAIAQRHGLRVIEDAAHAIGTKYKDRLVGSFGDLVCFSFHPNKNMTTIEGGAIVTADASVLPAIDRMRFHGITKNADGEIDVFMAGGKTNFSDVSARIGIAQLEKLDGWNERRRALARRYFRIFGEVAGERDGVVLPDPGDDGHSWHIFTVLVDFGRFGYTRPAFQKALHDAGIGTGVHYPSMPALTFYRQLGYEPERWPVSLRIGRETLTLPLFPAMRDEDVDRVVETFWKRLGKGPQATGYGLQS